MRTSLIPVLAVTLVTGPAAAGPERRLTVDEAIAMAVAKNEGLAIQRESVAAANAAVRAARGAYDPVLGVDGGWSRSTEPINSSFSGAPPGRLAPRVESASGDASIRQLLPTGGVLSLSAGGGRQLTDASLVPLSPAYDTRVGVELRQPLLRDRGIDAARLSLRVAGAERAGASATLRRELSETVAAVERAYWVLGAARRGVGVEDEAVRLAQSQLDETRTRVESGAAPRTELAQPRAELERRRGELLSARERAARSENELKRLILAGAGDALWDASIAPVEDSTLDSGAVDTARALERALASRPELEIAAANAARRRAESAFARDGVWPSLDAVVSYDRFGLAGAENAAASTGGVPPEMRGTLAQSYESLGRGGLDATRVALVLGLPIGNRTARGNAAVARHRERQAEADVERVRKAIRAEVLDAAAALEAAAQRIEAARAGREAAETQLAAERDRYASGMSTNFLVLTRQNDLSRARLEEISALTDYRTARTEMGRATGSLIEERGVDVDGSGR